METLKGLWAAEFSRNVFLEVEALAWRTVVM